MACRLDGAKPSTLSNKHQWNFNQNYNIFFQENAFESVVCEVAAILYRPQCVKESGHSSQATGERQDGAAAGIGSAAVATLL